MAGVDPEIAVELGATVGAPGEPSRRAVALALALLTVAAFALRLAYGWGWPDETWSWDERYSLENVRPILAEGSLEPVRNFYPSAVYNLPPALLMRAARVVVSDPDGWILDPVTGRFGPGAYRIGRGLQALYGALAVVLIYLLGARVFDRATGLLAALVLAFLPWHVQVSGNYKPDAQVVFFVLLALLAGSRWMRSPSWWATAGVGAAVALAASTKPIAGLAGAAFGVAAFATSWRAPRRLLRAGLAGVTAVALYLLLNPHLGFTLAGLRAIRWDYDRRAWWAGMTKAEIPGRTLEYLLSPAVFGPILGVVALIAFLRLWVTAARAVRSDELVVGGERLMLALFPVLYVAVHTAQSAWFRGNNFTHVLPPFVLALAWAVVSILRAVARRIRPPRFAGATAVAALCLLVTAPGVLYVYRTYTATTLDAVRWLLREKEAQLPGRSVVLVGVRARGVPWWPERPLGRYGAVEVAVHGSELDGERRRRADAVVIRGVPDGEPGPDVTVVEPELFRLRGPRLTLERHRWRDKGVHGPLAVRTAPNGEPVIELPELGPNRYVSLGIEVGVPAFVIENSEPAVEHGDESVRLHLLTKTDRTFRLASERFRVGARASRAVRLTGLPPLLPKKLVVHAFAWAPP